MKRLFFLLVCISTGIQSIAEDKCEEIQTKTEQAWQLPVDLNLNTKSVIRKGVTYQLPRLRRGDFKFLFKVGKELLKSLPPQRSIEFFTNETAPQSLGVKNYFVVGSDSDDVASLNSDTIRRRGRIK